MAIIRGPLPQDAYFIAERSWFRDRRLTHKAMGLLGSIASHSADWELTTDQLVRESADGKAAVDTGLRELERVGYLRRIKLRRVQGEDAKRRAGTFAGYDYQLCVPPPEENPTATGVVRAQPKRAARVPATTTTRKSPTGADQAKRGSTTDRFSTGGFSTGGGSGAKKYKGLEDQGEKPPLPPAADPLPAASVPGQRTGGQIDQPTVNPPPAPPDVDALVAEVHAARRWSRVAIRRVLQEIAGEGAHPWWAVAAVLHRVAADPLSRGPARLRSVPDDWWPDLAPPPRARLRAWCGGCVQRTRWTDEDRPRPCPQCSPQAAGMVAGETMVA